MSTVTNESIEEILILFSKKAFDARKSEDTDILSKNCEELFERDYKCCIIEKVDNEEGPLCLHYPTRFIIPIEEKLPLRNNKTDFYSNNAVNFDASKYKENVHNSYIARYRKRFPVPVIMCDGKFICRSSTVSAYETLLKDFSDSISSDVGGQKMPSAFNIPFSNETELWRQDVKLLKELSVEYICDLALEIKPIKNGMALCASEGIYKESTYSEFKIVQIPYPRVSFFVQFKDCNYIAEGHLFDWEKDYIDTTLTLPSDLVLSSLEIRWSHYKLWDLVKLTQNYLKLLLTYIIKGVAGILVHCRSGWDRTPLFISLLRLSLWADGRIHSSLTAVEITYLTFVYDWYFFGHDFPHRLSNGHEIMFFCFEFLKFITSDDFSSINWCQEDASEAVCSAKKDRAEKLNAVRTIMHDAYHKLIKLREESSSERKIHFSWHT